jgi:hypothetical protein
MQAKRRQEHHTCSLTEARNGASISSIFGSAIVSRVTCSLTFRCFFLFPHVLLKSTDVPCSFRLGMKTLWMLWIKYTPEQNTHEINFICQNTFHVGTTWNNHISENMITAIPIYCLLYLLITYYFQHIQEHVAQTWAQMTPLRYIPHFVLLVTV